MPSSASVFELSPGEYEQAVKAILDAAAGGVVAYSSRHLESIAGSDGDYIFDVTARFEALGVDFLVLVECKRYRRRVERQEVQVLWAKCSRWGPRGHVLCHRRHPAGCCGGCPGPWHCPGAAGGWGTMARGF